MRNRKPVIFLLLIILITFATACASGTVISTTDASLNTPPLPVNTATPTLPHTPTPKRTFTPSPTNPLQITATLTPTPEPAILIGAGDIGVCGSDDDEKTAALLDRFPNATIFTAGDNTYDSGRAIEFQNCYGPTWGRHKERTYPSPGNHDYMTDMAAPYFEYFGENAGEPGKGYYSYDLGDWHIVSLNSNCSEVACGEDSAQYAWLEGDLAASQTRCTLAYWHHPRWSSGLAGSSGWTYRFWNLLYEHGAEVVISGHDHNYERFVPMDTNGNFDPNGIRQFVVGTGGTYLRSFGTVLPGSEIRETGTFGVIKFTLYPDRYDWEFIPVEGSTFTDSGSEECH